MVRLHIDVHLHVGAHQRMDRHLEVAGHLQIAWHVQMLRCLQVHLQFAGHLACTDVEEGAGEIRKISQQRCQVSMRIRIPTAC